jgi:hypothetical protein
MKRSWLSPVPLVPIFGSTGGGAASGAGTLSARAGTLLGGVGSGGTGDEETFATGAAMSGPSTRVN